MNLYLQFGWGMMEHCRSLIKEWGGGTVILSPRDLEPDQIPRFAASISAINNGLVLLDPQFYLPHSDHERLCSHSYWPQNYATGVFFTGPSLTKLLADLKSLNDELGTSEVILPGLLADEVNDDWLNIQKVILQKAQGVNFDKPLCQTIALSSDVCRTETQVARLLEYAAQFKAERYYLLCEHPNGNYLVDDAEWLSNVLDIIAGLKLGGSKVIVGYCNHQMLIAGTTKADAIASGTWMNVRSFPPEKFRSTYDDEIKQRATWYYSPQSLSEYKLPIMDIARKVGLLSHLAPPETMKAGRVAPLFSGGQPSTIGLSEPDAFRHYLSCLKQQVDDAVMPTFDETVAKYDALLDDAEQVLQILTGGRIRGQMRDFSEIVDVNRAALAGLIATRGSTLRRNWERL